MICRSGILPSGLSGEAVSVTESFALAGRCLSHENAMTAYGSCSERQLDPLSDEENITMKAQRKNCALNMPSWARIIIGA